MGLHHLQQRIGRRMGVTTRRVVFKRGFNRRPARPQLVGQFGRVGVTRHARRHALWTFQNLRRASKTVFRQISRHQARRRGVGGVQLL